MHHSPKRILLFQQGTGYIMPNCRDPTGNIKESCMWHLNVQGTNCRPCCYSQGKCGGLPRCKDPNM